MPIDSHLLRIINASTKNVERISLRRIAEVVALAEQCRSYKEKFTFQIAAIEAQIDSIFTGLTEDIMEEIETKLLLLLAELEWEDYESYVQPFLEEEDDDSTLLERVQNYTDLTRDTIEGWIALGFSIGFTAAQIMASFITFADNPMASSVWRQALQSGIYSAESLKMKKKVGKGYLRNPLKGFKLLVTNELTKFYHRLNIRVIYRNSGAIGFRVHRGSNYFCPVCDANCVGVHPLNESDILPTHPRCVCWTTPVYLGDDISLE